MPNLPPITWKCLKCGKTHSAGECANCPKTWHSAATDLFHGQADHNDNATRAARVLLAIYPAYDDADAHSAITDTLNDLRHLCDLLGVNFSERNVLAHRSYMEEVAESGEAVDVDLKDAVNRELR